MEGLLNQAPAQPMQDAPPQNTASPKASKDIAAEVKKLVDAVSQIIYSDEKAESIKGVLSNDPMTQIPQLIGSIFKIMEEKSGGLVKRAIPEAAVHTAVILLEQAVVMGTATEDQLEPLIKNTIEVVLGNYGLPKQAGGNHGT